MPIYTEDQLFAKLERADAAGDTEAATAIADEIRRIRAASQFSGVQSSIDTTESRPSADLVMPDGSLAKAAFDRRRQQVEAERMANPTNGMSAIDRLRAGFGKSIVDTGRGIQQLVGLRSPEQVEEDRKLDAPLMRTGGGVLGNVGGQIAQMAVPARIPGMGAVPSAARPFVDSAVRAGAFRATQPMGAGENRALAAAQDAALGVAG